MGRSDTSSAIDPHRPFLLAGQRVRHPFAGSGTIVRVGHVGKRKEASSLTVWVAWDDGKRGGAWARDLKLIASRGEQ